jgi:signal transduction histidine kinase
MRRESNERLEWELATESIVVQLRWFGIVMGFVLVQSRTGLHNPSAVRAFLALGAGYAALDTAFYHLGEVFLKRWPLLVSFMESVFIALLCYHDTGLASPFRWYYLLSLICCAFRYRPLVAWLTFGMHCLSLLGLAGVLGFEGSGNSGWPLSIAIMAWVTWATSALVSLLVGAGSRLEQLNQELERNHAELEKRVAKRTDALRSSQARAMQQEKMAAFGLLAAGIAHEVGNPLASVSSLVQILERRDPDVYTAAKLEQVSRQLVRIQRIVRELVEFSRPASSAVSHFHVGEAVEEALGIAKYYPGTKQRELATEIPNDLPTVRGVRDHLTQIVLNLLLNAVDATETYGQVRVEAEVRDGWVELTIADDGRGISLADRCRLFQPYFTTKPHGTGLGLFVSRQIVEEMGGALVYRTETEEGSAFTVRLRADPVPPPSREATCPAGVLATTGGPGS